MYQPLKQAASYLAFSHQQTRTSYCSSRSLTHAWVATFIGTICISPLFAGQIASKHWKFQRHTIQNVGKTKCQLPHLTQGVYFITTMGCHSPKEHKTRPPQSLFKILPVRQKKPVFLWRELQKLYSALPKSWKTHEARSPLSVTNITYALRCEEVYTDSTVH